MDKKQARALTVANYAIRLLFLLVLAAISIICGMWLGLTIVDNYKLIPKHSLLYVYQQQAEEGGCYAVNGENRRCG